MRVLLSAIVAGIALGFGLYGIGISPTGSFGTVHDSVPLEQPNRDTITQLPSTKALPGSHIYAGLQARLNPNIIEGTPSVVCTTDARLFDQRIAA